MKNTPWENANPPTSSELTQPESRALSNFLERRNGVTDPRTVSELTKAKDKGELINEDLMQIKRGTSSAAAGFVQANAQILEKLQAQIRRAKIEKQGNPETLPGPVNNQQIRMKDLASQQFHASLNSQASSLQSETLPQQKTVEKSMQAHQSIKHVRLDAEINYLINRFEGFAKFVSSLPQNSSQTILQSITGDPIVKNKEARPSHTNSSTFNPYPNPSPRSLPDNTGVGPTRSHRGRGR